ncbi:acyltransferase [Labilibaculum sp. K2S]|uniref:acyltransferase n=1 Tax=Labilibaculum sp. K2S TaxID=3056386 RepID=UPI0025A3CCB6|nr:acyltransferase [Labilibaculum sp. K2S]MDM8160292.1 acyltransferase [Labilibaculum sp. K2S]
MITIHPTADVQSTKIGDNTYVWQYSVILSDAVIGSNCNINFNVFIENDVVIGDDVTVKPGVQIWDGIKIGNKVFIGPNVTFTNDIVPRSKVYRDIFEKTIIEEGASIGANSTIIAGIKIGQYSFIGAGSVVTKNVPANTIWYGNPATQKGFITNDGILLSMDRKDKKGNVIDI